MNSFLYDAGYLPQGTYAVFFSRPEVSGLEVRQTSHSLVPEHILSS